MSQDLCRHLCLWRPACQDLADSFCLVSGQQISAYGAGHLRLAWMSMPSLRDSAHPGKVSVG